ncbi:hypothetical protein C8Q80DRAFT_209346 [Daedaleopsis nitida]|nr:hypothetical protein C8Q80DRAFT_209346 [Daedaleopsis nitida]
MHLTLGVLSLGDDPTRKVAAAAKLLYDLRPRVHELLQGETLRVPLDCMDVMKPDQRNHEPGHIIWVGPAVNEAGTTDKLKAVAHLVQQAFDGAGLLADERRALKLFCPILSTGYREPRRLRCVPFSYASILASDALKSINVQEDVADYGKGKNGPVKIDFGTWEVDELQICKVGSWGPEGEYVTAARCSLN